MESLPCYLHNGSLERFTCPHALINYHVQIYIDARKQQTQVERLHLLRVTISKKHFFFTANHTILFSQLLKMAMVMLHPIPS